MSPESFKNELKKINTKRKTTIVPKIQKASDLEKHSGEYRKVFNKSTVTTFEDKDSQYLNQDSPLPKMIHSGNGESISIGKIARSPDDYPTTCDESNVVEDDHQWEGGLNFNTSTPLTSDKKSTPIIREKTSTAKFRKHPRDIPSRIELPNESPKYDNNKDHLDQTPLAKNINDLDIPTVFVTALPKKDTFASMDDREFSDYLAANAQNTKNREQWNQKIKDLPVETITEMESNAEYTDLGNSRQFGHTLIDGKFLMSTQDATSIFRAIREENQVEEEKFVASLKQAFQSVQKQE